MLPGFCNFAFAYRVADCSQVFYEYTSVRVGLVAPTCLVIIWYTGTKKYGQNPQLLLIGAFILGACTIAYNSIESTSGYGLLALTMVYMYRCVRTGHFLVI